MPPGSDALQRETAGLIDAERRPGDKLAVISFAENVVVEHPPQEGKFAGFSANMEREGSRLADAIDMGLSLIGKDESGRLLVLSDGRSTGRDVCALDCASRRLWCRDRLPSHRTFHRQ